MTAEIYMDNHATTRVDPRVVTRLLPFLTEEYGNASSKHHGFGRRAGEAVETARQEVSEILGCSAREIVFTSGATESNNLAIRGVAITSRPRGNHIITAATEHHAVLDVVRRLEREGFRISILPVHSEGMLDLDQLKETITEQTILVSLMAANNEIGTLHPLAEIGSICKARGVLFHTDAVQAVGRIPLNVEEMGVDLLSLSGHKIYGPKGVGALYVRRRQPTVRLERLLEGGGQERGLRPGTLNVPGIVGLGMACRLCQEEMPTEASRLSGLRDRLQKAILSHLEGVEVNGHPTQRLPGNLNLSFAWVRGEALLMSLRRVAVSSGSACTSEQPQASHVLRAIGRDE
ncbi:MAG: cysteine desulfurase family protein, partial [Gemmataceae bacterium]